MIDNLLAETRDVPGASDEVISKTRRGVEAEVNASIGRIRRAARRRTRRRRLAGAVFATTACATALLVLPRNGDAPPSTVPPGEQAARPTASASSPSAPVEMVEYKNASQVLAAAAAAPGPDDILQGSHDFWRVDSVDRTTNGPSVPRTTWSSRDAGLYIKDERLGDGRVLSLGPTTFPVLGRVLSWDDLFELPTDTKSMLSLLRGPAGRIDADRVAFKTVFELLSTSPAPRGARRALWLAAAELDGVSLIGTTNDAEGRQGWALTDGISTYIVSPQTGRLLESQYIAPDGAVSRTTILREGPTPTAPVVSSRSHPNLEDPQ